MKIFVALLIIFTCNTSTPILSSLLNATDHTRSKEYYYLALGDSYTIGEQVRDSENFPTQVVARMRLKYPGFKDPRIIAKTGWSVRHARARRQRRDAGTARHLRPALGGERGGLLVAHVDDVDALRPAAVVDREQMPAGQGEELRDAVCPQAPGDEMPADDSRGRSPIRWPFARRTLSVNSCVQTGISALRGTQTAVRAAAASSRRSSPQKSIRPMRSVGSRVAPAASSERPASSIGPSRLASPAASSVSDRPIPAAAAASARISGSSMSKPPQNARRDAASTKAAPQPARPPATRRASPRARRGCSSGHGSGSPRRAARSHAARSPPRSAPRRRARRRTRAATADPRTAAPRARRPGRYRGTRDRSTAWREAASDGPRRRAARAERCAWSDVTVPTDP